jgi:hypothetical protein
MKVKYRALTFAAMTCVVTAGSPGYPNGLYNPPCADCCYPQSCTYPVDCGYTTCEEIEGGGGTEMCEGAMPILDPLCDMYCDWEADNCTESGCDPEQVRFDCVAYEK